MKEKNEQRPDAVQDGGKVTSKIGLNDPNYHYRIVGKDKQLQDYDRIGKHKDMGYTIVKENNRNVVMACPKDEFEARQAKKLEKANRNMDAAVRASMGGDGTVSVHNSDFQFEKGGLSDN